MFTKKKTISKVYRQAQIKDGKDCPEVQNREIAANRGSVEDRQKLKGFQIHGILG